MGNSFLSTRGVIILILFCLFFICNNLNAASFDKRKIMELKAAVVFIHNGEWSGSGFLIQRQGEHGLIVTNQHVVEGIPINNTVNVVFNSGQSNQRQMRGILEAAIPNLDLALIKIQARNLPKPISQETRSPVFETEPVYALGFPFGRQLATNRETPRITITAGSVTSLRSDINDQVMFIQTDAAIDPGNSGGPVVDQEGRLVGVTVAKLMNTSISFVIPRRRLDQFIKGQLYNIDLTVERKWLDSERWVYEISTISQMHSRSDEHVEAGLNIIETDRQTALQALQSDQSWNAIQGKVIYDLKLSNQPGVKEKNGTVEIPSKLMGARLVVQPYLKFKDKVSYQAPLWLGLELKGENSFLFEGPNKAFAEVRKEDAKPTLPDEKYSNRGSNQLEDEERDASREYNDRRDKRSKKDNKNKVINLPGVIDSIALVGGGRYLAFGVDAESNVVLLDLQQQKLIELDLHLDEPTLVAGDSENVYVAGVDSGQLIKWSLVKKSVVQSGFSPDGAAISAIASGWDAQNNMLFIITRENFEILDTVNFNPKKLKWTSDKYGGNRKPNLGHEGNYIARASGNGKLFTFWGTKHSPAGVNVLRLRGEKVIHYNIHDTAGFVIPDRTGDRIYTSLKGAYTSKLDPFNLDYLKGGQLIPGIRGDYLLQVNYKGKVRVNIINIADEKIIGTLLIPELKANGHPYSYHQKRPTGDQRFWLSEDNNLLFVIPDSNDRVIIYELQMDLK